MRARGPFRDMRRDNSATTDGLATLRYGYRDVFGSPCEVAAQVAENLAREDGPARSGAVSGVARGGLILHWSI